MSPFLAGAIVFVSAFLLFQLQPMTAKAILPWFGGSAAVWGTCLMFFQSVLFLGYLYAHWLTRAVVPKVQAWIHCGLLTLSVLVLPVLPAETWKPEGDQDPVVRILALLTATVGLPYFMLSSTSPLVQTWFARTRGVLPYRYFALSNAASLVALLGYPILVEPNVALGSQSWIWSAGYGVFVIASAAGAWLSAKTAAQTAANPVREPRVTVAPEEAERPAAPGAGANVAGSAGTQPGFRDKLLWLLLAAFASVLSLAVTTHLSQNVAPIPMMWVLPLGLYLITFIIAFDSDRWYSPVWGRALHAVALGGTAYLLVVQTPESSLRWVVPSLLAGMFFSCLFCHGELARRKPSAEHLTQFYLMIALGGALGAIAVGVAVPMALVGPYDLAMAVAACALFTMLIEYRKWWLTDAVWAAVAVGAFVAAGMQVRNYRAPARVAMRSFYGGLRVVDNEGTRALVHGVVSHGMQYLDRERANAPTMYYAAGSGVQRAIAAMRAGEEQSRPLRVGVIGLGAGTLAAYGRPGDVYRFYEINPQVVDVAQREFGFLKDSPAEVATLIGDGRLLLEEEPPQNYDVLAIDAFSGDSVPVHLLSREALQLYLQHVRPDGIVAFHVSNSALALADVVLHLAEDQGLNALRVYAFEDKSMGRSESDWVLISRDGSRLAQPEFRGVSSPMTLIAGLRTWTDDYSTLFPILK